MPDSDVPLTKRMSEIQEYVAELRRRAAREQKDAKRTLNPLFDDDRTRPPRDFVDSSFLYMRACDADNGSRPVSCPQFWLSPDLRVAPLSNLGMPTRDLTAGTTYRITATVRNRGDLAVPSAKVEFYLVNPSLGFDTRFATKLGVAAGRVQAHSASEVALEYTVPPTLSGHRCLFARVFSFSPLDLPVDDYALNPLIDRHVAQLNLNIVGQGTALSLDWIHHRNARERLEIVPMAAGAIRALRVESVTALTLVRGEALKGLVGGIELAVERGEGAQVETRRTERGLELVSSDRKAVSLERQAELTKEVLAAMRAVERGRRQPTAFKDLLKEFRDMSAQSHRTRVTLTVPDVGLGTGQAVALNVIRRDAVDERVTGGIGLFVAGPPKLK